jgi:hypothetical protein
MDSRVYVMHARTPNGDAAFVEDFNGNLWMTDVSRHRLEPSSVEAMQQALRNLDFVVVGTEHQTWLEIYSHLSEVAEKYQATL